MIYGRFGDPCTIVRVATAADVCNLENRKPDKHDREALKHGSYVVVCFNDGPIEPGREQLYHQAFLRADDGSKEITAAIEALGVQP